MIDRSKDARAARRAEFDGLKRLPFLNREQSRRLEVLRREVVLDNRESFRADTSRGVN